jgi:hypothetical protein
MNRDQALLVTAGGQALFSVGGTASYAQHDYKGYHVSLEWDEQDGEPCMLVWSATGGRDAGVFGICLSSAGKYADPSGKPTEACIEACAEVLPTLGRDLTRQEVIALVDVVMRFVPDLILMPPAPRAIRRKYAGDPLLEVTTKDALGRVTNERAL